MAQTVHVLREPGQGQKATCDVVFFHGLQPVSYENAWDHTWRTEKDKLLWPADWLGQDFPTARILSISYDSRALGGKKTMDGVANLLLHEICMLERVGQDRPVVLVGHSLGGLVLKKLAVEAQREAGLQAPGQDSSGSALQACCKAFCNNLAGTFFFATPHGGAPLGNLAKFAALKGPMLEYLTVLNSNAAKLNRQFSMAFPTLSFMALVETKKYKPSILFPGVQVVPEGSAITSMHDYVEVDEDHITICKPRSQTTNTYRYLKQYIHDALSKLQERQQVQAQAQQRVSQLSPEAQSKLVEKMAQFDEKYTMQVEPSMAWFRKKKRELEPELGERWAEGLFPAGSLEEDVAEVTRHRKVTQLFWDDVKRSYKGKQLDDSFFEGTWAERGKQYRLLVEPVDIVNYYFRGLQIPADSRGHYIDGITLELSDDNNIRPGRYILLQKQEQRVFGSRYPNYNAQSSLGLARLLKESVGKRTWDEYKQHQHDDSPGASDAAEDAAQHKADQEPVHPSTSHPSSHGVA